MVENTEFKVKYDKAMDEITKLRVKLKNRIEELEKTRIDTVTENAKYNVKNARRNSKNAELKVRVVKLE